MRIAFVLYIKYARRAYLIYPTQKFSIMNFKNSSIADRYEAPGDVDPFIQVKGYRGLLSEVPTPDILDGMIARNSQHVQLRTKTVAKVLPLGSGNNLPDFKSPPPPPPPKGDDEEK